MSPARTLRATSMWCLRARYLLGGVQKISGLPVRFLPTGARDCRHALSGQTLFWQARSVRAPRMQP